MTQTDRGTPVIDAGRDANGNTVALGPGSTAVNVPGNVSGDILIGGDREPFKPKLRLPHIVRNEANRFLYYSVRLDLLGREEPADRLAAFRDRPETFLWWLIVGPGGSGKTRLAYEFCRGPETGGTWQAGFLLSADTPRDAQNSKTIQDALKDWDRWHPDRPTLIVADYLGGRASFIGGLVSRLAIRADEGQLPHRVRLLLLERDVKDIWEQKFWAGESIERSFQEASRHDDPLSLQPLNDDALWAIIRRMSGNKATERDELLAQLRQIDPQPRPLFAAFLGDAIGHDAAPRQWDRQSLLTSVLLREERNFWQPARVTEADRNWLCLATLTGGALGSWLQHPERSDHLPAASDQGLKSRYTAITGTEPYANNTDDLFAPLQPDLLGEFFVLHHLANPAGLRSNQAERLRPWLNFAWTVNPSGTAHFLLRLWLDFHDTPELAPEFFHLPAPLSEDSTALFWWAALENILAVVLSHMERHQEAIAFFDAIPAQFYENPDPSLRQLIAIVLLNKGLTLGKLGQNEAAIAVFDDLINRFGGAQELAIREQTAAALLNKGAAFGQLRKYDTAIAVYDNFLVRFDGTPEPAPREQIAWALLNKGTALGQLEDHHAAIAVFDCLIDRFGGAQEPAIREHTAKALFKKGTALGQLGEHHAAIAVYDNLIDRFGGAQEPAIREQTAKALFKKGTALGQLGKQHAAIAVLDDLIIRFDSAHEPAIREQAAAALLNKGAAFCQIGNYDAAIAVFNNFLGRVDGTREQVAWALCSKGIAFGELKQSETAIGVYDDLITRFNAASEPAIREQVARALLNKGVAHSQRREHDAAIAAYNDLIDRFEEAHDLELRKQIAKALINKGFTLSQLGKNKAEIAVYDDLVVRFDGTQDPVLCGSIASALLNKGITLGETGQNEAAIAAYDGLIIRFDGAQEPTLREQIAKALLNKGITLGRLGRNEDAIVIYNNLIDRFGNAQEPALREQIARALLNKGVRLGQLGRSDAAIAVCDDLCARFDGAQEPALDQLATLALNLKAEIAGSAETPDQT